MNELSLEIRRSLLDKGASLVGFADLAGIPANALLSDLGRYSAGIIRDHGYKAIAQEPTNVGIDPRTLSTFLPHKTVATRAGLGWIGKCALLVTEQYGSAIRLTTVLTNAHLDTAVPVNHSSCGDCMVCVNLCPGDAPSGENWNVDIHRDSFFNPFSCRRAALEQAGKITINETICGICISVCPWTKKYFKRQGSGAQSPPPEADQHSLYTKTQVS